MAVADRPTARTVRQPGRSTRRRSGTWPTSAELHQLSPILRLLSSLWTLDQVKKLGLAADDGQVDLWVVMEKEDLDAESQISALERAYRVEGVPEGSAFTLHVAPLEGIDPQMLPPFETILER